MNVLLEKWGKGMGIKIPESVVNSMGLKEGDRFNIKVEEEKMILTRRKSNLEELLKGVTSENKHDVIEWGKPVGKEVW